MLKKISLLLFQKYSNSRLVLFFIIAGLIIYLPYLFGHFSYDDFMFVSVLEENISYNPWTGFWSIEFKDFPGLNSLWWGDGEAEGKFFRPFPTFVFAIMFHIFGRGSVIPLHLISVVIHSLVAFSVFLLFNKLSKKYTISLLAAFLFLIAEDHSMTVGWIATNTDIFAVLFMNLSIYFYIISREEYNIKKYLISILFLILAFTCKETAVITPIAIILYEFIYNTDPMKRRGLLFNLGYRLRKLLMNWRYWGASLILLIMFLIFYKSEGFGINNLMYYDPLRNPFVYIENLFIGYPLMFTGYLSIIPFGLTLFLPDITLPFILIGISLFIIFIIVLTPYRKEKTVQFCLILFLLSILPQLSTDASERLLYYPFVAGSFLISFLIFQVKFLKKEFSPDTAEPIKYVGNIFGVYLIISSLIFALILSIYYPYSYKRSLEYPEEVVLEAKQYTDSANAENIIFLNTQSSFMTFYLKDIFRYHYNGYKDVQVLSSFNGKVWMNKLSDSSFVLKTEEKGWTTNMFGQIIRAVPKIQDGFIYQGNDFFASVIMTTPDKTDFLKVKFDFKYSLSASDVVILYYDGQSIKQWDFTNQKIGKWVLVGDSSDVMKGL